MKTIRELLVVASCLIASVCAGALEQRAAKGLSSLPVAAKASISSAIGRDNAAYWAHPTAGGFSMENSKRGMTSGFTVSGMDVRAGTAHFRLALRGYGYGNSIASVNGTAPTASGNRIEYRRQGLTEWYVNGPLGIEQGFTINERRGEADGQPLTVALAISGSVTARVDQQETSLSLTGRTGRSHLRYTGLTAYDATGKTLRAWLEVQSEQLLLRIDDAKARYPVVIDPWMELAELTASDSTPYSFLGSAVALYGNTLVVGSPGATIKSNTGEGAAYVFVRPESGWQTTSNFNAKLTASDGGANDLFGGSVSLAGDTLVVGANNATVKGNQGQGAVYVFVRPKSGWKTTSKFTAKLSASDGAAGDRFGSVSVAVDSLIVGAYAAEVDGHASQGAAYVFLKPASGWKTTSQFAAKLTSSDGAPNDFFGYDVSNGSDVIGITAYGHQGMQGEGYVFVKPAEGWKSMSESARLTASDGKPGDVLSSISTNGDTVVAGAFLSNVHGNSQQGSVYVFVKPRDGWTGSLTQAAKLIASNGQAGDWFGTSVTLSGNRVGVGALGVSKGRGAVYIFVKPPKGWRNTSKFAFELVAQNGAENDNLGFSSCGVGSTLVSGAPNVAVNGASVGAVYVFGSTQMRTVLGNPRPPDAPAGAVSF